MSQLVSIQQAMQNALAMWLQPHLASQNVVVEPRWFEADRRLPPLAISIIRAGPRRIEWTDPEPLASTTAGQTHIDVQWGVGYVSQALQLDAWATSDVALDDLLARLDPALNAGHSGLGLRHFDPVGAGLTLHLRDGWQPGIATYLFDEPSTFPSPHSVGEREWRALFRGRADSRLVIQARSPRIARVRVRTRLRESDMVDPTDPPDDHLLSTT